MEIVRVENLKKYYGKGDTCVKALDDVSFSIEKGEFVAIVGPSGSREINNATYARRCRQTNFWKSIYKWNRYKLFKTR